MNVLLEAYRGRFARDEVRQQGSAYNGPCPFCGGASSGSKRSDRFIVWPERSENLGETCRDNNISGVWYCRQCGKTGDTIAYLMESEGMTFRSACAELGIRTSAKRPPARRTPVPPHANQPSFAPKEWPVTAEDPAKWREYATKLHAESLESLKDHPQALEWLAARGLDAAALEKYKIGYLPGENGSPGRYRARSALGLSPKQGEDGRERKNIFIPRGIVIPHFDRSGRILRLRIRRPKPDIREGKQKYIVLEGSSSDPMLLAARGSAQLAAYAVVEAELDAMLIHHASGGIVGAFAALTNRGKPSVDQHPVMREAAVILVALDFDPRKVTRPDGTACVETPGGIGAVWWAETYKNAKRWLTPFGKDPGDAFAEGLDIREWLAAGLPPSISLAPESGPMEPFVSGTSFGGEGRDQNEGRTATSGPENPSGNETLPPGNALLPYPEGLHEISSAWGAVPDFAIVKRDDGGVSFCCNNSWARTSEENWNAVCALQSLLMHNNEWWHWIMRVNPHARVTLDNLLRING